MKTQILIISIFFLISNVCISAYFTIQPQDTIKQNITEESKATETESLILIRLKSPEGNLLKNIKITMYQANKSKIYLSRTNSEGQVKFLLPNNATYIMDIEKDKNYKSINIPNRPNTSIKLECTYLSSEITRNTNKTINYATFQQIDATARGKANAKQVDLVLSVKDLDDKALAKMKIRMVCENLKTVYTSLTNTYGQARILLPIGETYQIGVEEADNIDVITVPNIDGLSAEKGVYYQSEKIVEEEKCDTILQKISEKQKASTSRVLVNIEILDMDDKPLDGEIIVISSKKQKKAYKAICNEKGKARLLLPKNDVYCVSFEYNPNYDSLFFPASTSFETEYIKFNYLGSKAIKLRLLQKKKEIAHRDSLYKIYRIRDSLNLRNIGKREFIYQFSRGVNRDTVFKLMEQRAMDERKLVEADSKYFEKSGSAVQAVFYRLKNMWHNKLIVTDITGSMSPYWDQVLMWHVLKLINNEENQYIFFNDGNETPDDLKIIGKTGGIYYANTNKLEDVFLTMAKGVTAGNGGDTPENDIEALLFSLKYKKNIDELILIADNYANIKDISLLYLLNIPVRVVLCGTNYGINEDYLELAYKTKGSVHSIEKDIFDLYKVKEGGYIEMDGKKYKLNKGKFLKEL